jgi:hypothetical protein
MSTLLFFARQPFLILVSMSAIGSVIMVVLSSRASAEPAL